MTRINVSEKRKREMCYFKFLQTNWLYQSHKLKKLRKQINDNSKSVCGLQQHGKKKQATQMEERENMDEVRYNCALCLISLF